MKSTVAPGSDALWNATGETIEAGREVVIAPSTDAQWAELARQTSAMKRAMSQLAASPVQVVSKGEKIDGAGVAGTPQAQDIQARIDKNQAEFRAGITAMITVLNRYDAAIKARKASDLMDLGGKLDEACEACHTAFWYPDQKPI
ncbi:MAG: hypothetical protein CFE32_19660 [Alphaproteobacteria bacterium PA3]|nr:MAG: hypothetical protein CFE32_19660 [Alphaproteobacteria bacterium PA3]